MRVDFFVENLTNNKLGIAAARIIKPRKIRKNCKQIILDSSPHSKTLALIFIIGGNLKLNKKDISVRLAISDSAGNEQIMDVVFKMPQN